MSNERAFESLTHIYSDGDGDIAIINGYLVGTNEDTLHEIAAIANVQSENILTVIAQTVESTEIRYPFEADAAIITKSGEFIALNQFSEHSSVNILEQQLQEALEIGSYTYESREAYKYVDFSMSNALTDNLSSDEVALLNAYVQALPEKSAFEIANRLKTDNILSEDGTEVNMDSLLKHFPKYENDKSKHEPIYQSNRKITFTEDQYERAKQIIATNDFGNGDDVLGYIEQGPIRCEIVLRDDVSPNGNTEYFIDCTFYVLDPNGDYGVINGFHYKENDGFYTTIQDTFDTTLNDIVKKYNEYIITHEGMLEASQNDDITWEKARNNNQVPSHKQPSIER